MNLHELVLIVFVLICTGAICGIIWSLNIIAQPWKYIIIVIISLCVLWWTLGEVGLLDGAVGHTKTFR